MTDESNVTPIRPRLPLQRPTPVSSSPDRPESDEPDWVKTANRLHEDAADLPPFETPSPTPELEHGGYKPSEHPAGSQYQPEKDAYDPTFSDEEFPAASVEAEPALDWLASTHEDDGLSPEEERKYASIGREGQGSILLTAENDFDTAAEDLKRQIARTPFDDKAIVVNDVKLAEPVDPRRRGVLIFALVVAGLIFATSALFSFATVATAAAEWMLPAWPWLAWVVPGFVEAFIIYFGVDAIINQANGRKKDAASALLWMFVFAAVGVVANGAHTASSWLETGDIPWQGFIGIAMSALAPLSVVLITKRVSKLVFLDPNG